MIQSTSTNEKLIIIFLLFSNVIRRSTKGMEMIFRISLALLELHQDELMLLSMEDMLKVITF